MNWKLVRFRKELGFTRGHLYLDGQWVSDTYEHGSLAEIEKYRMLMVVSEGSIRVCMLDTLIPAFLSGGKWRYITPFDYWRPGDILPISRTFCGTDPNTEANQHIFTDIQTTCRKAWMRDEKMTLKIMTREGMGPVRTK